MSNRENDVALGVGLIGIGRVWGHKETAVPSENEAQAYLATAFDLGIRFFDTAPAYGSSEKRLGKFVRQLSPTQRAGIVVATKFGEHWDATKNAPYTDHSYPALTSSIDQSIARLGKIDLLQLHKTSPAVLKSEDFHSAIDYAKRRGITQFGASVSDIKSAQMVCDSDIFSSIQFPLNETNQKFVEILQKAQDKGKTVIINRPFNMGAMLYDVTNPISPQQQKVKAYQFILQRLRIKGIVLTGTKSPNHLQENLQAFTITQR